MQLPTVSRCCCVFELRLGTILIGITVMIGELSTMIKCAVASEDEDDRIHRSRYITASVMTAVMMVTTILLLVGAYLERPLLIKVWLVIHVLESVIALGFLFFETFVLTYMDLGDTAAVLLFITLILMVIVLYKLLVVYSYYVGLTGGQPGSV